MKICTGIMPAEHTTIRCRGIFGSSYDRKEGSPLKDFKERCYVERIDIAVQASETG